MAILNKPPCYAGGTPTASAFDATLQGYVLLWEKTKKYRYIVRMEQFIVALKELLPTGRKRTLGAIVF